MWRTICLPTSALISGIALGLIGPTIAGAQQEPVKRTDLLKTDLDEIKGSEMQVWVADIAPGAGTGRHSHPTPRFVYVVAREECRFQTGLSWAGEFSSRRSWRNKSLSQRMRRLKLYPAAARTALARSPPRPLR